jgi:hypothetical protein
MYLPYMLICARTDVFDKTEMHNYVKNTDGEPKVGSKSWVYNHYVPHSRILKAIEANILDKTRLQAFTWLRGVTRALGIQPDQYIERFGDAMVNRVTYDAWVDWCIGSICDWRENIFYGPGTGDKQGTSLDHPKGGKRSKTQEKRVEEAAKKLQRAIGNKLSLAETVKHTNELVMKEVGHGTFVEEKGEPWYKTLNTVLLDDDSSDSDFESDGESDNENEVIMNKMKKLKS